MSIAADAVPESAATPEAATPAEEALSFLSERVVGWASLHGLGNSKFVQSSGIWIVVTPALGRFLNELYQKIGISLPLPGSLVLLYLSALFFAVASIVFFFRAPEIFKRAPTYSVFKLQQHSALELRNWFHDESKISKDGKRVIDPKAIQSFLVYLNNGSADVSAEQTSEILAGEAGHALLGPFWWKPINPHVEQYLYELTAKRANIVRPKSRWATLACYVLGFGLLLVVFVGNVAALLRHLF